LAATREAFDRIQTSHPQQDRHGGVEPEFRSIDRHGLSVGTGINPTSDKAEAIAWNPCMTRQMLDHRRGVPDRETASLVGPPIDHEVPSPLDLDGLNLTNHAFSGQIGLARRTARRDVGVE